MADRLKIYHLTRTVMGGGGYVPPDPGGLGGDYYADSHERLIVTASSWARAEEAVWALGGNRREVRVRRVAILGDA